MGKMRLATPQEREKERAESLRLDAIAAIIAAACITSGTSAVQGVKTFREVARELRPRQDDKTSAKKS